MALPPGLILNPATGELTGVPTQAGAFTVNVTVRDTLGTRKRVTDQITIAAYTVMTLECDLGHLMDTRPMTGAVTTRTGGQAPYIYTIEGGSLPAGLSLDANTGEISGTPTEFGEYAFTLRVTDQLVQTKDVVVSGEIAENLILTAPAGNGLLTVGVAEADLESARVGGTAPFEFALIAGTIPPGLALDAGTGALGGTATADGTYSGLVIEATDTHGFTAQTAPFELVVKKYPTLGGALVRGTVGEAYASSYVPNFGHLPYAYGATGLPAGLSISAATGAITGTPTTAGTSNPVVTLTDDEGNVVTRSNAVAIAANLTLTGTAPAATREVAYSFRPTTAGGWPGYSYAVTVGALPDGLTLNASTGLISGTPTTQSENAFTVTVTDADGNTELLAMNISVAGDLSMTGTLDTRATTTVAYSDDLGNAGGTAPFAWSISAGALPPGITMSTSTGAFSGTPTTPGTYNFTVRVRDANASYAETPFSIVVAAHPVLGGSVPDGSVGVAYSRAHPVTGGHAPLAFDLFDGTLPDGLSLNATTGTISGTPTTPGTYNFTIRVTDDLGNTDVVVDSIAIFSVPALSGSYETQAEVTVAYSDSMAVTGGKPSIAWSLAGGALPPGLTLNNGTGAITGTPTAAGTYGFTIRVTDALGRTDTSAQSITVAAALNFAGNRYSSGATRGIAISSGSAASGGVAPIVYSIASGSLPPGLSLNSATAIISGTPTTNGTYSYRIIATDALGNTSLADPESTEVRSPVTLSGSAPKATVGVAYGFNIGHSGGWGPFTYSIVAGGLPAGLSLNASTGRISGTPSGGAGTATVVIRAVDNQIYGYGGSVDDHSLSIVVALFPTLSYPAAHGTVGRAFSVSPSRTGGHAPFSYALVDGSFPPGISINSSTGVVSGTPTTAGSRSSRVRLTDAMGNIRDEVSTYAIAARVSIDSVFASPDTEGTGYSSTISSSGGWGSHAFTRVAGTLPPGLTLTSGGTLTGTSTTPGTFGFTVRATDDDGNFDDRAMSVTIIESTPALVVTSSPSPSATTVTLAPGQTATAIASSTASASGGTGSKTFTWAILSRSGRAASASGTSSATLHLSLTSSSDEVTTEVWRVTGRDAAGVTDTYDVQFTLRFRTNN